MGTEFDRIQKGLEKFFGSALGKPILNGFVRDGRRICGKKNCRCERGILHPKRLEYGYCLNGKSYLRTVPAEDQKKVVEAVLLYRMIQGILEELSQTTMKELPWTTTGFRRNGRATSGTGR